MVVSERVKRKCASESASEIKTCHVQGIVFSTPCSSAITWFREQHVNVPKPGARGTAAVGEIM